MKILKVRDVKTPTRGTDRSAGIDFYVPNDFKVKKLFPGDDALIPSGIIANIPSGFMLLAIDKSSAATSTNAKLSAGRLAEVTDKPCLIIGAKLVDEDYTGEIHLHIINVGKEPFVIRPGYKIVQFVLVPVNYEGIEEVDSEKDLLEGKKTNRGANGFGSTGIN